MIRIYIDRQSTRDKYRIRATDNRLLLCSFYDETIADAKRTKKRIKKLLKVDEQFMQKNKIDSGDKDANGSK